MGIQKKKKWEIITIDLEFLRIEIALFFAIHSKQVSASRNSCFHIKYLTFLMTLIYDSIENQKIHFFSCCRLRVAFIPCFHHKMNEI